MVENLRKAEFDAAQPVRNKETGKVDYIVRVADHKTAESAPGVITLEPHIHQLLGKYVIIRQHVLDSASLLVNIKGRPFTNVSEAVARLHRRCGFTLCLPTGMHVSLMRHGHRTFHRRRI